LAWLRLSKSLTVEKRSTDDVESKTNAADDKHELWMIHHYGYISRGKVHNQDTTHIGEKPIVLWIVGIC
jgi:hypothetical protein